MFGRFFHLMIDAVIISVALSGIKRSTGLTPAIRRLPNKDLRNLVRVYLETGEWVSVRLTEADGSLTLTKFYLPSSIS